MRILQLFICSVGLLLALSCGKSNGPEISNSTIVSLDSVSGHPGDTVSVDVAVTTVLRDVSSTPHYGMVDFAIQFDPTALSLVDARSGSALNAWEYFTWRNRVQDGTQSGQSGIQIISIRTMTGYPPFGDTQLSGNLARIKFLVNSTIQTDTCLSLRFWSNSVAHNSLYSLNADTAHVPLPGQSSLLHGPGFDSSACQDDVLCLPALELNAGQICVAARPSS